MAIHPSESEIVGRTVRQAKRLEEIDSIDEINILEVNYTVSSYGCVTGVELVLTVGGPDIRVEALNGTIRGAWEGDTHITRFDSQVIEQYGKMLARQFEEEHDL